MLSIGSEQLEHVPGCKTTAEPYSKLNGVFQRKNIMNKMKQCRKFCTVVMSASESMLSFINRLRYLGENIKAMGG